MKCLIISYKEEYMDNHTRILATLSYSEGYGTIFLRSWPSGGRGLFPSSAPGFKPHCERLSPPRCLTCSLGLQDVQWAVKLVVVSASWSGQPRK